MDYKRKKDFPHMPDNSPLSIYIHWPFCKSKCPYCDFFKRVKKEINQEEIINSYMKELEYYQKILPQRHIRSIFFGGGTPSLINPEQIRRLIDYIGNLWTIENHAEISLEANPNSEYPLMFENLRKAGINRLSLGVQALNDKDLHFLGRTHNTIQALHCIEEVLKNFDNHSMDLIYARPNQNDVDWQHELEQAVSFGFRHLSLYQLTIEDNTVFAAKKIKALDEENAALMYCHTTEFLAQKGYPRYEVSNFANPPYESIHNKCYWEGGEYIGIGESAHGRIKIAGQHFAVIHPHIMEPLSPQERAEELLIMGLRLQKGINKINFEEICGLSFDDFINEKAVLNLTAEGLIVNNNNALYATAKGFLLLDKIIEMLCQ